MAFHGVGDEECVGPQHVHLTTKHDSGLVMIWECMMAFGVGSMVQNLR